MKRLLIVSPHFPPASAPDMQRVRMSLPHYEKWGWEPVVLTVRAEDQHALQEPELKATVPSGVRIEAVPAWPYKIMSRLGIRNIGLRSWFQLWKRGCQLLEHERFDAILFSTTQFFVFPLGPLWKKRHGVPYILDIQDPWLTDYYYQKGVSKPPGGWKYHVSHAIAWLLESWTYRHASGFISVSNRYLDELSSRYSWFGEKEQATIGFGASLDDQKASLATPIPEGRRTARSPEILHFVYTGAAGPIMPKALNAFFDSLHFYRTQCPEKAARLRFHFIGTSYAAPGNAKPSVLPIAREWGVADLVEEIPCRVGFLECLRHQAEADVLLLLGSSDPAYSPSKLYTYFLSDRPILAPVFKNSVLEGLLRELQCARIVLLGDPAGQEDVRSQTIRFFEDALSGFPEGALPVRNTEFFNKHYLAETLTGKQCRLLERAAARNNPP
jgi:hypothetical protein